jgi:mono/diheme cytochrome c family protein
MPDAPVVAQNAEFTQEQTDHGRYLVTLLGCGSCHTNGALVGQVRSDQLLAGSDWGIAYTNPLAETNPGVVYPANLTPDPETGIGTWTTAQIVAMITTGMDNHGDQTLPVMPWPAYRAIQPEDALTIAAYLKSLPPVRHQVPADVRPGQRATSPYVHFGVYQSRE